MGLDSDSIIPTVVANRKTQTTSKASQMVLKEPGTTSKDAMQASADMGIKFNQQVPAALHVTHDYLLQLNPTALEYQFRRS